MDFSSLSTLDSAALTASLAVDFSTLDNTALAAGLSERRAEGKRLFALATPSINEVNVAEALVASIAEFEAEQAKRAAEVKSAAKRFAAAKEKFAVNDGVEDSDDDGEDDSDEDSDDDDGEDVADDEGDEDGGETVETAVKTKTPQEVAAEKKKGKGKPPPFETASGAQRIPAARKVGSRAKRPAVKAKPAVTITASADVPGFSTGQSLDGMEQVTKALLNRVKGFAPFNLRAAQAVHSQSGGEARINAVGVASFGIEFPTALTAAAVGDDYGVVKRAIEERYDTSKNASLVASGAQPSALTAAGWCAPSENVYSFIADYVVDGLSPTPEVNAPRGGLNVTTGPVRRSQGTALDDFGWTQTEAQAEAGQVKPFEVIDCPDFVDHRLDAIGYAYKIPLLTQKAYPELVTDALRFASVLYAHRKNRRVIADKVALSDNVTFSGYGASFTDSLEALTILATRERRRWNLGENAVMEVEAPLIAREVYRADMSRRTGLALSDIATDQKIAAEFAARHLNVTYVADWQEVADGSVLKMPGSFKVMVYPKGTFVSAVEDVVNLSAIYDAASLSVNEYTGVFFEQGYMLFKAGYGSSLLTIPVNTAGETGAAIMTGLGDSHANGSF